MYTFVTIVSHTVYNIVDIFVLASQYLSHSVVPDRAAHHCRWFLSMSSCRPHNMQKGLSLKPIRWRCFPRQSYWTISLKTATDVFLGQSGAWTISFFQCLSLIFLFNVFFLKFVKKCLIYSMTEWYDKSLECVCKIIDSMEISSRTLYNAIFRSRDHWRN